MTSDISSINWSVSTNTGYPPATPNVSNTNVTPSNSIINTASSNVPTPTSAMVYTADAPKTTNPDEKNNPDTIRAKIESLIQKDLDNDTEIVKIRSKMREINEDLVNADDKKLKEYLDNGKISEEAYEALCALKEEYDNLKNNSAIIQAAIAKLRTELSELESQQSEPTVTSSLATTPTGPVPSVATPTTPVSIQQPTES